MLEDIWFVPNSPVNDSFIFRKDNFSFNSYYNDETKPAFTKLVHNKKCIFTKNKTMFALATLVLNKGKLSNKDRYVICSSFDVDSTKCYMNVYGTNMDYNHEYSKNYKHQQSYINDITDLIDSIVYKVDYVDVCRVFKADFTYDENNRVKYVEIKQYEMPEFTPTMWNIYYKYDDENRPIRIACYNDDETKLLLVTYIGYDDLGFIADVAHMYSNGTSDNNYWRPLKKEDLDSIESLRIMFNHDLIKKDFDMLIEEKNMKEDDDDWEEY